MKTPIAPEFVLLTGSLGSGKTTLLCDYLSLPDSADTGVIVNEAGEINVDGAVIAAGGRFHQYLCSGDGNHSPHQSPQSCPAS